MRKSVSSLFLIILFSLFIIPSVGGQVAAAFLKFDKTSVTTNTGDTFTADVIVDPGTNEILGVDAYILYDSSLFQIQSVADGSYFSNVVKVTDTAGRAHIAGLVSDPASPKTGVGTIATVTFKVLKAGTGTLSYDCADGATDKSKIDKNDIDATNIIECSKNLSMALTANGTSITPTAVPTASSGTGSGTNSTPSVLPQTGFFDNILKYSVPGVALVILGSVLKLFL